MCHFRPQNSYLWFIRLDLLVYAISNTVHRGLAILHHDETVRFLLSGFLLHTLLLSCSCSQPPPHPRRDPAVRKRDTAVQNFTSFISHNSPGSSLTLILLTGSIWWAPNNASKWQMGFNSAFKGLIVSACRLFPRSLWLAVRSWLSLSPSETWRF
jgi:hypothetical protein